MKRLWKYAIFAVFCRGLLMVKVAADLSDVYSWGLVTFVFGVMGFWGYRDIKSYRAKRKVAKEANGVGNG